MPGNSYEHKFETSEYEFGLDTSGKAAVKEKRLVLVSGLGRAGRARTPGAPFDVVSQA
jgi:hypothetical protein